MNTEFTTNIRINLSRLSFTLDCDAFEEDLYEAAAVHSRCSRFDQKMMIEVPTDQLVDAVSYLKKRGILS
jgi:hypothetical protein